MSSRIAQISISKYLNYWKTLRSRLDTNTLILAVVKANAYGLGAPQLAHSLQKNNCVDYLGVATCEEAHALRSSGILMPIFVFSQSRNLDILCNDNLEIAVYSAAYIRELSNFASSKRQSISVHLKINTGMNRIGCPPSEAPALIALIQEQPYLKLRGIWTHLAHADNPKTNHSQIQLADFKKNIDALSLSTDILIHAANSATCRHFKESHFSMVRIGIDSFDHILTLKSQVQSVAWVEKGEGISYGGKFVTTHKTQIATVEMGYADGIPRSFSGDVLIKGKRYPVVGHVCMDLLMIDVGLDRIDAQDEVVFVGSDQNETITLGEFSEKSHRITYESLCAIGPRVERHYEN